MFIYNLRLNVPIYGWQIIEKKEKKIKWRVFEESIDENSRRLILNALILNWEYLISEISWHVRQTFIDIWNSLELIGEGYIYTDSHGNLVLLVRGRSKEHNQDAVMTQVAPADG